MLSKAAAQKLSTPDLFRMLNERLGEECSKPPPVTQSATLLQSEVCCCCLAETTRTAGVLILCLKINTLETRAQGIRKLIDTLRNALRNMLSSKNRLPPEIISYIARCVLDGDDVDGRSIIPLTHVCRFWRESIVSTPEIWTLIYSESAKLSESSLERAKVVPLTVHVNLNELKRKQAFLNVFLPHIRKTVSLTCVNVSNLEDLTERLNFPDSMPNLRSLSLTRPRQVGQRQPIDTFNFSTHTTLRELSLYNIPLIPSILSLRTLTKFFLFDYNFRLHIDTLLNFLEGNRSLESANLTIGFVEPSLCRSHRQTPIGNKLQQLSISSGDTRNIRALISGVALARGGTLQVRHIGNNAEFTGIFSGVSMTHLPSLTSPVVMEYGPFPRSIRLLGPDGTFSYKGPMTTEDPFGEFPLLPLAKIRELRLECRGSWVLKQFRLSSFPSLEVLAVDGGSKVSLLSPVLPDPASSPSLETLAFLNCVITENFMAQLTQVALDRTTGTSTSLRRLVIIDSEGELPAAASIERLRKHVSAVEVLEGREFPKDLSSSRQVWWQGGHTDL